MSAVASLTCVVLAAGAVEACVYHAIERALASPARPIAAGEVSFPIEHGLSIDDLRAIERTEVSKVPRPPHAGYTLAEWRAMELEKAASKTPGRKSVASSRKKPVTRGKKKSALRR